MISPLMTLGQGVIGDLLNDDIDENYRRACALNIYVVDRVPSHQRIGTVVRLLVKGVQPHLHVCLLGS